MTAIVIMVGLALAFALLVSLNLDQTFSIGWSGGAAPSVSSAETLTGDTSVETTFTIPSGNVVDQEQIFAIDISGIQGILIVVSGNALATVTMQTNDGSTPDDTLVFPIGGGRFFWDVKFPTIDGTSGNPFDVDLTKTYWTHNAAEEVTVYIRVLYNG